MFTWNLEGYKMSHIQVSNQELHMKIINLKKKESMTKRNYLRWCKEHGMNFFRTWILLFKLHPLAPLLTLEIHPYCHNKIWTDLCIRFMKLKFVSIDVLWNVVATRGVKNIGLLLWVLHCKRKFSCHTLDLGFLVCCRLEWSS